MATGAQLLRDWMKRRGLDQRETAVALGFAESFLSLIVNGKRNPGLNNAVKIEDETGIPVKAWSSRANDKSARRRRRSAELPVVCAE